MKWTLNAVRPNAVRKGKLLDKTTVSGRTSPETSVKKPLTWHETCLFIMIPHDGDREGFTVVAAKSLRTIRENEFIAA